MKLQELELQSVAMTGRVIYESDALKGNWDPISGGGRMLLMIRIRQRLSNGPT